MFNYTHMIKAEQTEIAAVNNCRCFLGFVSRSSSINSPPHLPLQRKQPNMIPTSGIRKALTTDREVRRVRGRFSAMACKEEEKWPHENCNLTLHRLWRERTQPFGAMISGIVWVEKRELELVTVPLETTDLLPTNHNLSSSTQTIPKMTKKIGNITWPLLQSRTKLRKHFIESRSGLNHFLNYIRCSFENVLEFWHHI